jgi:ketosteroid isomerase-like protein
MERSSEAEGVLEQIYKALQAGDVDALSGYLDEDIVLIGTDPEEWWEGKDDAVRIFRAQAEELGGGFPIEAGQPTAFALGDVAWFANRPAFVVEGERIPCRHTGVLRRADAGWRLVSSHISIGVANEEAMGEELTT